MPIACVGFNIDTAAFFGLSTATMIFIIALIFMVSQIFKKTEWETYAKIEIHQVLTSVILMVFIYVIGGFFCQSAVALAGGDPFEIANKYLNILIYKVTIPSVYKLNTVVISMQTIAGLQSKFGAGAWGYTYPLFPGAHMVESAVEFVLYILTPFTASLVVQQVGLELIKGVMFTLVLPAGVLLRVFPPTRDAGVFLIATALAFYVVFPMTYVMHAQVMTYLIENHTDLSWKEDFRKYISGQDVNGAKITQPLTLDEDDLADMTNYGGLFNMDAIFRPLQLLAYTIIQAIFLPALSMIITTTFIKTTSKFISQKLE
ncbi:hypothetical protein FJZ26_05245 [Candidatus Parvarchaeota archaeon]|nr:hypothetical protein [Candidatus Parvarchaeota archaeon]